MFVSKRTGYFFGCSIFHYIHRLHVSCTHATILFGFKSFLFVYFIVCISDSTGTDNNKKKRHKQTLEKQTTVVFWSVPEG